MVNCFIVTYRLLFGMLGTAAIITEIVALLHRHMFQPANFFSYFTIQSNTLCAVMLLALAYSGLNGKQAYASRAQTARGAITLYIVMTGIIFTVLLAPIENAVLTAVPWDNIVLHYIMPLAVLTDWLFFGPRTRISFQQSLICLLYPFLYVVYSLVRGAITAWYPYPFLNAHAHGYVRVIVTTGVLIVFVLLASQAIRLLPKALQLNQKG